jgi:hypothetical protein
MSIAFEPEKVQLQKLRERLRPMSDEELIKFRKMVRELSVQRVMVGTTFVSWCARPNVNELSTPNTLRTAAKTFLKQSVLGTLRGL